ncbi:MAG: helicase C-terminal domain-containing protein [Aquificaceae bacterium]|nr:hypothetical protein [Aquificaceae bacterium]MDW8236778.1 helicase C-terminal domain-containing protein [Aquificaceae bacterium]
MRYLSSKLGYVFEGAFKIGLLEEMEPSRVEGFRKTFFEALLKEGVESYLIEKLKKPTERWEKIGTYIDHEVAEEKYTKILFLIGLYSGRLYGQSHKEAELVWCELGEESYEIVWKNADLVFKHMNTLHFVDFKLAGSASWIRKLLTEGVPLRDDSDIPRLPVVNFGVPVNISVGELDFFSFVENFLKVRDALEDMEEVFMEIKGLSQLICYSTDYLMQVENVNTKEVCFELIYPIPESYRVRFYLKDFSKNRLQQISVQAKELYKKLKEAEPSLDLLDKTASVRLARRERVRDKLSKEIEELLQEMELREKEPAKISTDSIEEVRKDVRRKLGEFMKKEESCKAIALLHSAGGGKTSGTRELILNSQGKHIVLYMATRLRLIEKELEKLKSSDFGDIKLVYERSAPSKSKLKRHTGQGFEDVDGKKGILKRTVEAVMGAVKEEKYRQIWSFATIQALVETGLGSTVEHLKQLLRPIVLDKYQLHFILDEFFGYRNGLFAIRELLELLKQVQKKGGIANLYLFDANGYSPSLLDRLLKEFKEYKVVPDSIILCSFEEECHTNFEGISLSMCAKHGYPAKELLLYKKILKDVKDKEDIVSSLTTYIKQTFKDKSSSAFVFVQDKEVITYLARALESDGISTLTVTASSKKSQRDINEGKEDVIIGTSAVSRGLDFSRPYKPVDYIYILISDWGIEQNLVEILQAISRARGDRETERRTKHLHLVYILQEEKDDVIENLLNVVEFKDKDLVKLLYRREHLRQKLLLDHVVSKIVKQFLKRAEGKVLVPVPAQHDTTFRPNRVNTFESIVTFLEDIQLIENTRRNKVAQLIQIVLKNLYSAVNLYTNDVPSKIDNSKYQYYHPYLIIEGNLQISFDNEKRRTIEKLLNSKPLENQQTLKEILKEHNEDRVREIENFLKDVTKESYATTFLLPVYSWIFVNHVLDENKDRELKFILGSRVGRGGALTLGGRLQLRTRCYTANVKEYAVIPLGEDYPYREVLSGRFAKFPIEFIKNLQEEQQ